MGHMNVDTFNNKIITACLAQWGGGDLNWNASGAAQAQHKPAQYIGLESLRSMAAPQNKDRLEYHLLQLQQQLQALEKDVRGQ